MNADSEYRELKPSVERFLGARYARLSPEDREEVCHDAFLALFDAREQGREIVGAEAYLIESARHAAQRRVVGPDARRRVTVAPDGPLLGALPDMSGSPQEQVLDADEARRVRLLIENLDEREQAVVKLRFGEDLKPAEVRARLGLTHSQYQRLAKRAARELSAAYVALEAGAFSRRQRSLLCACLLGWASPRQERSASRLLEDPHCRALLAELRGLGQKAASLLPAPPLAAHADYAEPLGRIGQVLSDAREQLSASGSGAKQHAVDSAAALKQHANAAWYRTLDPTPLAAARPGAATAAIAGCLAVGGGTYCAIEGVPDSLRSPLGLEVQQRADDRPRERQRARRATLPEEPVVPATPLPDPEPAPVETEPPPPAPEPSPVPVAAPEPEPAPTAPPPAPAEETFGIEQSSSAPSSPPSPAPAPAPSSGGGGATSEFGFER